ncbi:MAG: DUF4340 domain-containing protein [Verrucomicrobia bacterium]|jgi:hypothetical protein|nr:DUF4340 domain-containing protein [Verrucomicrobiota bacterium]
MTFRHTSLLFIVAGVLLGYVWLFENPFQEDAQHGLTDRRLFPGVNAHSATAVEIKRSNETLRLVKGTDGWKLDQAQAYPADESKIDAFLTSLAQLQYQSAIPPSESSSQGDEDPYGVKSPSGHLQIEADEGTFKLEFGSTSPGNITFVKIATSDQVYTLSSEALKSINTDSDHWRDPRVFPHATSDITKIQIVGPGNEILLTRPENTSTWVMNQPHQGARLDESTVKWFLQALAELRIAAFTSKNEFATQVTINLGLRKGQPYSLHLKSPHIDNPALLWAFLPNSETSISLPTAFAEQIVDPVKAFRNPYVLDSGFAFDSLEVQGEEKFTLTKDSNNGKWSITKPNVFPADDRLVGLFLRQLVELRINDFVTDKMTDESRHGIDFPLKTLTFYRPASSEGAETAPLTVRFSSEIRNHVMTHRSDEPSIYAVPFGAVMQLPLSAYQLRERTLWTIKSETISRIRVIHSEQPEYDFKRVDGIWQKKGIAYGEVESAAFQELVEQLASVKAEAWTGRGTEIGPRYGIGKKASIVIETLNSLEEEARQISFGSVTPRGHLYAMSTLDGVPTIFEFPGALYVKLNQLMTLENASDEE